MTSQPRPESTSSRLPPRSAIADAAALRSWEDGGGCTPGPPLFTARHEDLPARRSAHAEAAALRWLEQHDMPE